MRQGLGDKLKKLNHKKKGEALPTWLVTTLINREKIKKETSLIEVSLENKTVEEGETYSRPHSDCVCTYVPVDGNAGGIVKYHFTFTHVVV